MRYFTAVLLSLSIIILSVVIGYQENRIKNLERQLTRVENDYQYIASQNEQLKRINEQNLLLLSKGGWYDFPGSGTDN